jgi:autotransporter-associated beta strand protein
MFHKAMVLCVTAIAVLVMVGSARAVVFDTYWDVNALLWDSGNTAPSKTVHMVGGSGLEFDVTIATDAGNLLTGPYKPGGVSYLSDTGGVNGAEWFAGTLTFTASNFTVAPAGNVAFQLMDTSGRQLTSSIILLTSTATTPTAQIPTNVGFGDKAFTNLGLDSSAAGLSGGQYQATITWQVSGNGEDYGLWREFTFKANVLPATDAYWDLNGTNAGAGGPAPAGTWNAANTNWNAVADGTGSTAAWTSGLRAVFAAGTDATDAYIVTVDGTRDIGDLKFQRGTVTLSPGTAGALRLTGFGDVEVAAGLTATISTPISRDVAGRGLDKTGPGTLVLSGAGSYTGRTAVQDGTLRLGADNVLPDASAVIVGGNAAGVTGTLDLAGHSDAVGSLTLGGSTSTSAAAVTTGGGTLTLGGDVTYGTIYSPTICLGATISGKLDLGAASRTFTVNDSPAAGDDLTVSADISAGAGLGLTKAGAGVLVLSGANTYTGTTTISAGTLSVAADNNLGGANPLVFDGGALRVTGTALTDFGTHTPTFNAGKTVTLDIAAAGNTFTVSQVLNQTTGGLAKAGAGTLVLSGDNSYTGATTVSAGTLVLLGGNNSAGATTLTAGTLQLGGAVRGGLASGTLTFGNAAAGAAVIQPVGADRAITNNTVLDNAYGTISGSKSLEISGTFTNSGGNRTQTNNLDSGKTLTLSGQVMLSNNNTARTLTISGTGTTMVPGAIVNGGTGAGGLTKSGTGTLVLFGANTYSGATMIGAGGKLYVNGSHNPATSAGTTYSVSGTLGGSGAITTTADAVTVNSGGKLAPGTEAAPGTLTLNLGAAALSLDAAKGNNVGEFTFRLGTNSDKIVLGNGTYLALGTATADNLSLDWSDFTFIPGTGLADGVYTLIDADTSATGGLCTTLGLLTGPIGVGTGTLSVSGGQDLILTVSGFVIPGDTNGDKVVDAADFITLKKNFGKPGGVGQGDFNSSGTVNWADLGILMSHMGPSGHAPATAPEPATLGLLAIGALAMLRRRRA